MDYVQVGVTLASAVRATPRPSRTRLPER